MSTRRATRAASEIAHVLCARFLADMEEKHVDGDRLIRPIDAFSLESVLKAGRFSLDLQRNQAEYALKLMELTGDKDRAAQLLERAALKLTGGGQDDD